MTKQCEIQFSQLYKTFGNRIILQNAELQLYKGVCLQLTGSNGAGKSTLLRILAGLEKPDQAVVSCAGKLMQWRHARKILQQRIMYLHQQPYMFDGSVSFNLGYAISAMKKQQRQQKIQQALEWAELGNLAEAHASTLSGGEKQRVALARAWLHQPSCMLLDEPTANLDTASRYKTLQLLHTLKQQGISLIVASHDDTHFSDLFDQTLQLHAGKLEQLKTFTVINSDKVIPITRVSA